MPKTKAFKKMIGSMNKQYGAKRGERIAYATAKKRGMKS